MSETKSQQAITKVQTSVSADPNFGRLEYKLPNQNVVVSVDINPDGHLVAELKGSYVPIDKKQTKMKWTVVIDKTSDGAVCLLSRDMSLWSDYPVLVIKTNTGGTLSLTWGHEGLFDQKKLISSNDTPLVVYNPPRLIDTSFSTEYSLINQSLSNKWYVFMNRRVRPVSELKESLSEYQREYYEERDKTKPVGSEWYSIQVYPSDIGEWDTDTFLVAECATHDILKSFTSLFYPNVHFGFSPVIARG